METEELKDEEKIWEKIKNCLSDVADEICGKETAKKKQRWMTNEIMNLMETRRRYKGNRSEEGQKCYKEIKHKIQSLCRKAKDDFFNNKCKELEELDRVHSNRLHAKVKEFKPVKNKVAQVIKDKNGKILLTKDETLERWAEYVENLYSDDVRSNVFNEMKHQEVCVIDQEEIF
mgnify:CR=1 FL=1